jgi:hypothetical protein
MSNFFVELALNLQRILLIKHASSHLLLCVVEKFEQHIVVGVLLVDG